MGVKSLMLALGVAALIGAGCNSSPTAAPSSSESIHSRDVGSGANAATGTEVFHAIMDGSQQFPKVSSVATGSTSFVMNSDSSLVVAITVADIADVTSAQLMVASPTSSGSSGLVFSTDVHAGPFNGLLVQRAITPSMFTGALAGKSTSEFYQLLKSGSAYVNVATVAHPEGEIRGMVVETPVIRHDR